MNFTTGATRNFEVMMTAIPNFSQRGSGRAILHPPRYTPQTVDCKLCTEYRQKKCGLAHCPYLKEKIEAGAVDYKALVEDCFAGNKIIAFGRRITFVYERRKPSLYKNAEHRDRFTLAKSAKDMRRCNTPPHILAALFLLTASFHLFSRCETAITNRGICFEKVNLRGIAMNDYIVFQAAKTIYTGKESITISDLGDRTVVEDAEFYAIVAACLLAKYGADLLSLEETFREDLSKWYE